MIFIRGKPACFSRLRASLVQKLSLEGAISKELPHVGGELVPGQGPRQFSGPRRMEGGRGAQVQGAVRPILSQHCGLTQ